MAGRPAGVPGLTMAGNFYTVRCPDCGNEQVVFGKVATDVACAVCGHGLAEPTGGKADIEGEIVDIVEARETADRMTTGAPER